MSEPQSPAPVDQVLWQRHTEPVSDLAANPRAFAPARVVALTGTRSRVRGVIPVVVMCLSALVSVASTWGARDDRVAFAVNVLVPLSLVATGLLLRTDVQRRANASLCFWAAGFFAVSNLTYFEPFGVWLIGWSLGDLLVLPLTVLLLRYPGSRLSGRAERVFIGTLVGWLGLWIVESVLAWVRYLLYPTEVLVLDDVYTVVARVLIAVGLLLLVALVVLVGRRLARTRGVDRRELIPVAVATLAIAVASALQIWFAFDDNQNPYISLLQSLTLLGVPVAFLVASVQHRLARGRVADLVVRVAHAGATADIQEALRRALVDPRLEVLFWAEQAGSYLDGRGAARSPTDDGERLRVPVVDVDGNPIALVLADPSLQNHRDLVDAAVGAAGLALQNARLHAVVLAQLAEVRTSRQRIVEAGVVERRRVERDLHDGAQQRLLGLSMRLGAAGQTAQDPRTLDVVTEARAELRLALQELRDLARGIHPAILTQSGLAAAVESVAERAAVPVDLDIPPDRWPAAVETTAYFVISEALANAAKHAPRARMSVTVGRDGDAVRVDIRDDGPGGAVAADGGGLAGLRDRVGALGGTLAVDSPVLGGTRLTARIPCG